MPSYRRLACKTPKNIRRSELGYGTRSLILEIEKASKMKCRHIWERSDKGYATLFAAFAPRYSRQTRTVALARFSPHTGYRFCGGENLDE